MSVVVKRDSDGKVFIFTKGADGTVIPLAKVKGQDEQSKICQSNADEFARKGFRTLVFGMRELMLTESEVKETAQRDLECSLDLLGVTAMEDLL